MQVEHIFHTVSWCSFNFNIQIMYLMEPYQLYLALYLGLYLFTKIYLKNERYDTETEEWDNIEDTDILSSPMGIVHQIDD